MADFEFEDNSPQVLSAAKKATMRALWKIGAAAEGYAKLTLTNHRRIDTGRLRNSIGHKESVPEQATYIGTNVEYAIWHEVGTGIHAADGQGRKTPWAYQDSNGRWHRTRGIKPLHYLKKACTGHTKEYKELAQAEFENASP